MEKSINQLNSGKIINRIAKAVWFVYVLLLENDKYYIGITTEIGRRFEEHQGQDYQGANWCKKYKPIKVIEEVETNTKRMKEALIVEDLVTLRYIKNYGYSNVRGGRYFGSDRKIKSKSRSHLNRGYIHMFHKLYEDYNIWVNELEKTGIFDFVNDSINAPRINMIITWAKQNGLDKGYILRRLQELASD
ncbi:GIY-YIG nuclease family protein [Aquimarina gracilis]|uniref:GIY-YIG nuclease family protein n=1 Tax=Aquimarina gracilis TaxID=874422 RepID=A0ABU5ZST2_9FLAO|nr:GIY-YIG nuclease family protein [Aquimarina gracilis]MEB3344341.1 GIY-YIG nuclease family protein [Aquimarina gracilis]